MPPERVRLSQETLLSAFGDNWSPAQINAAADLLAGGEGQFPSGVRSLPPDLVKAVQRERVIAGMLRASAELGYRELSVQDVLDRAGVSRPTFYEHFQNKEDCFLAAYDVAARRMRDRVEAAAANEGGWRRRLRAGLDEVVRYFQEEPDAAMTLVVEARAACPAALERRDELLEGFGSCIDADARAELAEPDGVSSVAAAGVVGGIESLLYSRINRGDVKQLDSLVPSLMYFAVLPFEGHEIARAELDRAAAS